MSDESDDLKGVDIWLTYELPVLRATVHMVYKQGARAAVSPAAIAAKTELTRDQVDRSLASLKDEYLIVPKNAGGRVDYVLGVTAEAKRVAGLWPRADLEKVIEQALAETTDPEKSSTLRGLLTAAQDAGKEVVKSLIVRALTGA